MTNDNTLFCILKLIKDYENDEIGTELFVVTYQDLWRQWRDSEGRKSLNDRRLPNILDRIFTAVDCFKPLSATFRLKSDLDEDQLKLEIDNIVKDINDYRLR
jgi:Bacterial self-protective colicin-like immunity